MTALDDLATTPFHQADPALRARMLSQLANTELAVTLVAEPAGDEARLRMFPLEGGQVALACDSDDRLAQFFGAPIAWAAMPGRVLAGLLRAEGAGLLVNPGHPSEMLLDAAMLDWLADALAPAPEAAEARLRLTAPSPETVAALAEPLAQRLADLGGLISGAALVGIAGPGQVPAGHVLLIAGADPEVHPPLAKALAEALAFLPPQPGGVDISFSDAQPPFGALHFDPVAPQPEAQAEPAPARPKGPPILR